MPALGPYIKFSAQIATHWCYFDLKPNAVKYFEAPYIDDVESVRWQESALLDAIYVYDPQTKQVSSYIMGVGVLYQIPLQIVGTQKFVKIVLQKDVFHNEIRTLLSQKKVSELNIKIDLYPNPLFIVITKIPELSSDHELIEPQLHIDAFMAHDLLQVFKCFIIVDATKMPAIFNDGEMYVWNSNYTWFFAVGFLGKINSGEFNQVDDARVIQTLNDALSAGDQEIDLLEFSFMRFALTRPYLILTHEQQMKVVATLRGNWPIDQELSSDDNIKICQSVITNKILSDIDESDSEKLSYLNNEIYQFRQVILPSSINRYFKQDFYTTDSETTIADVIVFIKYLLVAVVKKFRNQQELVITQPPACCRVKCGELEDLNNNMILDYQALSEQHNAFLEIIINYYENGVSRLNFQQMLQLISLLEGLTNPDSYHDTSELANQLLVIYSVQNDLSQDVSQQYLHNLYEIIFIDVCSELLPKLLTSTDQELLMLPANYLDVVKANTLPNRLFMIDALMIGSELHTLLQSYDLLLVAKNDFALMCKNNTTDRLASMISSLKMLQNTGILTISCAQKDWCILKEIQQSAFMELDRLGLLTQEYWQKVRASEDPKNAVESIIKLKSYNLIDNPVIIENLDVILRYKYIVNPVSSLQQIRNEGLLTGDTIKTICSFKNTKNAADVFIFMHNNTKVKDNQIIQANLNAIINYENSYSLLSTLQIIINHFGLTDELFNCVLSTKRNFILTSYLGKILEQKDRLIDSMSVDFLDLLANVTDIYALINVMQRLHDFGLPRSFHNLKHIDDICFDLDMDLPKILNILFVPGIEKLLTGPSAQHNYDNICKTRCVEVVKALIQLHDHGILTPDIVQMICDHSVRSGTERDRHDCIVLGLLELQKHNLLRQDLITLVCSHRYPAHIISAMALMQENTLLYDDLLVEILQQEYPNQYLHKIIFLKKHKVLEHNHIIQANRFAILSNDNAIGILEMLLYISNTTELTDNIVKSIMTIANQIPLEYFAKNFKKIMSAGLKSENIAAVIDIFTTLTTRLFFDSVTNALCTLSCFNLITVDNLKIFTHAIANRKVQLIYCLDDDWVEKYHLKKLLTGPLAQKNYMTLANADCPKPASIELIILDDAGLLSENGDDQKYREILMHSYPDNKANVIIQLERLNLMSYTIAQELRLTVNPLEVLEKAKILQTKNAEDEYISLSFS